MNTNDIKLDKIIEKLDNLELSLNIIKNLENRVNYLENIISNNKMLSNSCNDDDKVLVISSVNKFKEIKYEYNDLDKAFIKSCLNMASIHGDIKIFRKIYIDNVPKEYYPIRYMKKKFQYWANGSMNDDNNGEYIKNIIMKNIEQCYMSINIYENYTNNIEDFLKNQDHINKLSEHKYKDMFLIKIIEIIDI